MLHWFKLDYPENYEANMKGALRAVYVKNPSKTCCGLLLAKMVAAYTCAYMCHPGVFVKRRKVQGSGAENQHPFSRTLPDVNVSELVDCELLNEESYVYDVIIGSYQPQFARMWAPRSSPASAELDPDQPHWFLPDHSPNDAVFQWIAGTIVYDHMCAYWVPVKPYDPAGVYYGDTAYEYAQIMEKYGLNYIGSPYFKVCVNNENYGIPLNDRNYLIAKSGNFSSTNVMRALELNGVTTAEYSYAVAMVGSTNYGDSMYSHMSQEYIQGKAELTDYYWPGTFTSDDGPVDHFSWRTPGIIVSEATAHLRRMVVQAVVDFQGDAPSSSWNPRYDIWFANSADELLETVTEVADLSSHNYDAFPVQAIQFTAYSWVPWAAWEMLSGRYGSESVPVEPDPGPLPEPTPDPGVVPGDDDPSGSDPGTGGSGGSSGGSGGSGSGSSGEGAGGEHGTNGLYDGWLTGPILAAVDTYLKEAVKEYLIGHEWNYDAFVDWLVSSWSLTHTIPSVAIPMSTVALLKWLLEHYSGWLSEKVLLTYRALVQADPKVTFVCAKHLLSVSVNVSEKT